MTRQANPNSKWQLNLKAKDEIMANKFRDLKKLALQDGKDVVDLIAEFIDLGFKIHHWPPGNPQLTLTNYHVKPLVPKKCGYVNCKDDAVGVGVYLPSNKQYNLCSLHFSQAKNVPKVWVDLKIMDYKKTVEIEDKVYVNLEGDKKE